MPWCWRAVPERGAYPAKAVRRRAWLMIRILPGSSRRVPAWRSQIVFAGGRLPRTLHDPRAAGPDDRAELPGELAAAW